MTRVANWEQGFLDFIAEETAKPFSWEENNCLSLVVKNIKFLRGGFECPVVCSWGSQKASRVALRKLGFNSLSEALSRYLEEINPMTAQRGDVGVISNGAMVCVGGVFVGRNEEGRVLKNVGQIEKAFKV